MPHKIGDRVLETTTTTGTGNITVAGAVSNYQTLAALCTSNGDTIDAVIAGGTQWEYTRLTRVSATVFSRATPYSSSTGSAIDFAAGTKEVWGDVGAFFAELLNTVEIAVASASTCDIGAVKGVCIEITGTTTITSFGTSAHKLRFIRFSGALTLTHNVTSLILPGGNNITTAAGLTLVARSDGSGNWRVYGTNEFCASFTTTQSPTQPQQAVALRNVGAAQWHLINGKITESRASDAATFAIKGLDGNDPSATNPVTVIFGDGTQRAITAALNITVPATATLGVSTTTLVAFRLWFSLIDDGGTLRLGVRNCSDGTGISGFPGNGIDTSTTIGVGADNIGVTYTGTGATAKQFVIIGFVDYESGLVDEGLWNAAPTRIQLFGPGMPRPGDSIQTISASTTVETTTTSSTYQNTNVTKAITLGSKANLVRGYICGVLRSANAATNGVVSVHRDSTDLVAGFGVSPAIQVGCSAAFIDKPNSTSAITYTAKLKSSDNTNSVYFPTTTGGFGTYGFIELQELMG